MAGSVNKVILVGNLGRDPESRNMQSGDKVVSFSIATSESWNDRASGERKEKTQWHRIAIFNQKLGEIAEKYLKKGSKVYLEGSLESRKFTDKDGNERETTEVVLGKFRGELTLLDGRGGGSGDAGEGGGGGGYGGGSRAGGYGGGDRAPASRGSGGGGGGWDKPKGGSDLDDDIPF
jgi:single-strand DNA-binding protein